MTPPRATALLAGRRPLLLLVLAALAAHALSLGNAFVWDDAYNVVDNAAIRDLGRVPSFFTQAWGAQAEDAGARAINTTYWRPLALTSYALDHALWGLAPAGFHLTQVLLHAAATCLVWRLARRLLGARPRAHAVAFAAALPFAWHPVHTEAVDVISYRTDLMAGLALLAGLVVWLGPPGRGAAAASRARLLGVPLIYAAGLASKEMAITLPLSIALIEALEITEAPSWRARALRLIPLGLVAGGYLLLRAALLADAPSFSYFGDLPRWRVALTMIEVFGLYARLLVAPWPLNPWYDWSVLPPVEGLGDAGVWVGLVVALAWLGAAARAWRRAPAITWALVSLPLTLLPVSHVADLVVGAGERYLYAASAGPLIALAWLLLGFEGLAPARRLARGSLVLLLLVWLGLTQVRTLDWRSDRAVLEAKVRDWPHSYTAWVDLAGRYEIEGEWQRALDLYERLGRDEEAARVRAHLGTPAP